METQEIASLRIHVARGIHRVKEYDILAGVMPASLASSEIYVWTMFSYSNA